MPQRELREQSRAILAELGLSLAKIYRVEDLTSNDAIDRLLNKLYSIPSGRDLMLEQSNQRVRRLLSNTANQSLM